jgi:hypothetical protein
MAFETADTGEDTTGGTSVLGVGTTLKVLCARAGEAADGAGRGGNAAEAGLSPVFAEISTLDLGTAGDCGLVSIEKIFCSDFLLGVMTAASGLSSSFLSS